MIRIKLESADGLTATMRIPKIERYVYRSMWTRIKTDEFTRLMCSQRVYGYAGKAGPKTYLYREVLEES